MDLTLTVQVSVHLVVYKLLRSSCVWIFSTYFLLTR